jgi:hypothetical protein
MGASLDALDPDLRQGLLDFQQWLSGQGVIPTITSTVRSYRDQKFLYDRYQNNPHANLPAAPPGHSAHEYGWAFDMIVSPAQYQHAVGKAWEKLWGGKWGGARDPVHFELPGASQLAWHLGESGAQPEGSASGALTPPAEGGAFYKLADFLSSFTPLGVVQIANTLVTLLDGHTDIATWYLDHPAEAVRDLVSAVL